MIIFILLDADIQPKYSYTYHKEKKKVGQAQSICEAEGGRLLTLNSKEEMDQVTSSSDMDQSKGWWLGLSRPDIKSNAWKWSDDSVPLWNFPWDEDDKLGLCARMTYIGDAWKFKKYACVDKELFFICKSDDAKGKSSFAVDE